MADRIAVVYGVTPVVTTGRLGEFSVRVDGEVIIRQRWLRAPSELDISRALDQRLGPADALRQLRQARGGW